MSVKQVFVSSFSALTVYSLLCYLFGDPINFSHETNVAVTTVTSTNPGLDFAPETLSEKINTTTKNNIYAKIPYTELKIDTSSLIQPPSRMNTIDQETKDWCEAMKTTYDIHPQENWGRLPAGKIRKTFRDRQCGKYFTIKFTEALPMSVCTPSQYTQSVQVDSPLPLIAVMAASTTRGVDMSDILSFSLFTFLLPSLVRSLDCGYRYVFVLGYDTGDPFFDSTEGMAHVVDYFQRGVAAVLQSHGIHISLKTVAVDNTSKKPGPVFQAIARAAFDLGAEFFYRVNDDIEFRSKWPHAYVTHMRELSEPYGVIGPWMVGRDNRILTVDFTHRRHMEIFDRKYYPDELIDWWMDDWISAVYGSSRTFRSKNIQAFHHSSTYTQRYTVRKVSQGEQQLLVVLRRGVEDIRHWMTSRSLPKSAIDAFDKDKHSPPHGNANNFIQNVIL